MKAEAIRAAIKFKPFRPFTIQTGSGESYLINHPEIIIVSPDGTSVVGFPNQGEIAIIDVASITEIITHPSGIKIGGEGE